MSMGQQLWPNFRKRSDISGPVFGRVFWGITLCFLATSQEIGEHSNAVWLVCRLASSYSSCSRELLNKLLQSQLAGSVINNVISAYMSVNGSKRRHVNSGVRSIFIMLQIYTF